MFGRVLRLEPATGRKINAEDGDPRERRFPRREGGTPFRRDDRHEFSTLRLARPLVPSMAAVQRPVVLPQINPILGRRMFGLAASIVLRRRVA
jgi:hypothetical protein